jgi:uncharacterized protein YajQ (UPF0234 family)
LTDHVFTTCEGKSYTFDTEVEMKTFAKDHAINTLVSQGKIVVTQIEGEQVIRITRKGLDDLNLKEAVTFQ